MDVFFNKINLDLLKNKTPSPYSCHLYKLLKNADLSQKCNIKIERNIPGNRKPKREPSKYFDTEIQDHIYKNNHNRYDRVVILFNNRTITLNFIPLKQEDEGYFMPYMKCLTLWFKLMNMLCPNPYCNKTLDIDIYLSGFKKQLPNAPNQILGSKQVNSAFTYPCNENGTIMIYRKEEWFKVLLHECIHSFCLDFSLMNQKGMTKKLSRVFGAYVSSPRYSETYAELWAQLLQCAMAAYFESKANIELFSLLFDFYTQLEYIHSVNVAVNILKYMNLSYSTLREKKLFNQHSHIFEYYILKTVVLSDYNAFLSWCLKMNGYNMIPFKQTNANCISFCNLIVECYINPMFIGSIHQIGYRIGSTSLRMSIVDII